MTTANEAWIQLTRDLLMDGAPCSPRGKNTREILGYQTRIDMRSPVLTLRRRKLGYKFLAAEAAWILSGDNKVSTIAPFSKQISEFSDDGTFFHGAYGPKVVDQLTHVVESLVADLDTRQAVINIWRENPRHTKDVPCTISVQFVVRGGALHCMDTMRSSDAWLGWPYDVFNFSMLSGLVCLLYRRRTNRELKLGALTLTAGSQHLYESNFVAAAEARHDDLAVVRWDYAPFDPNSFHSPEHLVEHLWALARRSDDSKKSEFTHSFLTELVG